MVRVLSKLGAEVSYFVPHRFHDHYGLSERAVRLSGKKGIGLVVAVDCGVSDYEAIAAARELGMDVIVVDHHEPGPTLPAEALVVNPKRADSVYPFTGLTAVGLAYKLSTALCQARGIKEDYLARAFLDLVAVGTIADVAPLVDENRGLCGTGLQLLPQTRKVGLRALLDACQLNGRVSASDVGFRVAPRLNAVGRMGDAHQALELLLTDDPDEALRLTLVLDGLNRQRQREQDRIYVEARQLAEEQLAERDVPVLVLSAPDWHLGVIGIVASKIVEDFGRPAVILAQEPEVCRGSGRSIEGFDMAAAFAACGELLQRSGGHALAGGLTLSPQYLPEVREKLCHLCAEALTRDQLETPLELDCEVRPEELTPELAQQVSRLEPCGQDNLAPLFLTRSLEVVSARPVGREGNHLKLTVAREAFAFDAIGFGMGNDTSWLRTRMKVDLAHVPEINAFNGTAGLQLHLTDLREAEGH